MAKIFEPITGINGVAAGGVATAELPVARNYHDLTFYYKGNAAQAVIEADILWIRLKVNGNTFREILPAELFVMQATNNRAFVAGEIHIPFSRPDRMTVAQEEATSLPTFGQSTFTVEMGIAGTAAAPSLSGYATYDLTPKDGQEGRPGLNIEHWIRQSYDLPAGGSRDIKTLPKGVVQRIHFFCATSAPTALLVQVGNRNVIDASRTAIVNRLGKTPIAVQAKDTPACFDGSGQLVDALPVGGNDDYNVRLTSADAQACVALSIVRKNGFA